MNIPNAITLLRVVLIPFYIDLMIYDYYGPALLVFLAACVTDALDGLIARLTRTQTELGAFLDPAADKLLILYLMGHKLVIRPSLVVKATTVLQFGVV